MSMDNLVELLRPGVYRAVKPRGLEPMVYVDDECGCIVVSIEHGARSRTFTLVCPHEVSDATYKTIVSPRLQKIIEHYNG